MYVCIFVCTHISKDILLYVLAGNEREAKRMSMYGKCRKKEHHQKVKCSSRGKNRTRISGKNRIYILCIWLCM